MAETFVAFVLMGSLALGHVNHQNSTYSNPILPGFHPDPSCILVPSWDNTYFCASSSFNAFPGIPIHASKDLRNWKLIGNAISRPEMLPKLAETIKDTSGIWAPTLRYRGEESGNKNNGSGHGGGRFWISTTLVFDDLPSDDESRWDNFVISTDDPFDSDSWTDPVHFDFGGYDTSLFWDDDGQVYVTGSHEYKVWPGIQTATINLQTGDTGPWTNPWNGTGGLAPEGPHLYKKDDYYYLMLAEGGTGEGHMVTMARSRNINGPYEPAPHNPVLTNANTTAFFQAVGHADLFQDTQGSWWAVALSTRSGPDFENYPMGRETALTPVTWEKGEWPILQNVHGITSGWELASDPVLVSDGYENALVLRSSVFNLTSTDGRSTGGKGQTFIGRRQTDSLFTYLLDINTSTLRDKEDEVGISVFLTEAYHFDLGIALLPQGDKTETAGELAPFFRFRGMSGNSVPETVFRFPSYMSIDTPVTLEIKAFNWTHYSFAAGPQGATHLLQTYGVARGDQLSAGFTGTLVGPYATTNGREGSVNGEFEVSVGNWTYLPQGQIIN
ncbi:xylosidase : arabinofuranosidase [Aspergillus bombycis]|uniref:Xylosidase: arabinofuranosidase n=1 Tax=Aspergillus bombycis TaxID=109264 RepID=A0A1F8ACD3_9EURO|nr:xylosidase : arabinofuranosidase [Aspergillus bombycis]OGM49406.1 xylosidase : arabinofuranosidase [Aspergillus bombycis]